MAAHALVAYLILALIVLHAAAALSTILSAATRCWTRCYPAATAGPSRRSRLSDLQGRLKAVHRAAFMRF